MPLLEVSHDWQRARALQRAGEHGPPPLVVAGLDVELGLVGGLRQRLLRLGGMAIVFGAFPATLAEYLAFARARLFLHGERGRGLDRVLGTRILALWAWLPGLRADCYLEYDRATDEAEVWILGAGEPRRIEPRLPQPQLDDAFLEGLVLAGPATWGGSGGLERLVQRHGEHQLLVAAQLAELLERRSDDVPGRALARARRAWATLVPEDDRSWLALGASLHPWAAVQLGRLALRCGRPQPARALLARAADTDAPAVAWFDLGQACEVLGDLAAAAQAFQRYAERRASDPDGWRRLLWCRLRLADEEGAELAFQRWRENGGDEDDAARRLVAQLLILPLPLVERARLAGWLAARLERALARLLPLPLPEAPPAGLPPAAWQRLREGAASAPPGLAPPLVRVVLLALPPSAPRHPDELAAAPEALLEAARAALQLWCRIRGAPEPEWAPVAAWLRHWR